MEILIIAAHDALRGIGRQNTLPWSVPADMARFVRETRGHPVIMGRKTRESIGKALPGRLNIAVSSNRAIAFDQTLMAGSLEQALELARQSGAQKAFIIGGALIYEQALAFADALLITEIHAAFDCDAFFPAIDPAQWPEASRERVKGSSAPDCDFVLRRRERPL